MKRLVDALAPGQRVWVSTLSTESTLLREELMADPERARGVTFMGVQFPGIDRTDYLALHPQARLIATFMSPQVREGLKQGRAELLPLDYQGLARCLAEGAPADVAIAQLSPPDNDGWCSPGLASDFLPLVWTCARRRIAHINPQLPRTRGSFRVHLSELDDHVDTPAAVAEYAEAGGGETELRIAANAAQLVRDGDTLQFGIGAVPMGLAEALRSHRMLRLHTGMVARALQTLWTAGSLDGDARITTGVVLGDAQFQAFATGLESLWLTDVRHTHDPALIGRISRFVAVNGAVEVDLFGQANSERASGALQAGAGGLPAFAQGALRSPGGRVIICLPATARKGAVSRIVTALDGQSLCTLPRYLADAVVTEYGVAEIRDLSMDRRAEALIAIAAPDHRAALANAWDLIRGAL
ncbi:MAG: uncharacterized protein JWQ07_1096 [Ramlibacter sp.]|nr:uncharacterized protein [Ramlibacter sp.]